MMKHNKRNGLTLPEILVGMFLLSIILLICTQIFVSTWRRYNVANAILDVHSSAVAALDRFSRDLRETTISAVRLDPDLKCVYFPSARDNEGVYRSDPNSFPQWQSWMIFYLYLDPARKTSDSRPLYYLARKQVSGDIMNPPASIPSIISNLDGATIVSMNIYEFEVTESGSPGNNSFEVRIEARKEYAGRDCGFTISRTVFVSNLLE